MTEALLEVRNLKVYYDTERGTVRAVDDISFNLPLGQNLALVGESGCGKTTVAKAILHLLADNASIRGGEIIFKGQRIDSLSEKEFDKLRWNEIAVISQSAMNALNPVYRVGDQIIEAIEAHQKIDRKSAREKVRRLFQWVGLAPERARDFPHQFSGGMKQRAIIAMSLALNPSLIIADEPTTALDVVMQDQVMEQIVHIQKESDSSILMISHDISVVTEVCQYFVVMYAGKVVEACTVENFHNMPCHPYSMGLLLAFPTLEGEARRLISIPGFPPDLSRQIDGCIFYDRCPFRKTICQNETPPNVEVGPGHLAKCHFAHQAEQLRPVSQKEETWEPIMA
ncbi:MAG: ABC transporter ATP-binding protein [Deltaproteobacteria bacterium]|nr:ABC transporter ATP-binding protein [Deltaproteobacteria bacterium]